MTGVRLSTTSCWSLIALGDDGSISDKLCGWCQRVEDGGRTADVVKTSVHGDKPENHNYEDLQIHLQEGYGIWAPDCEECDTGWIHIPDHCGAADPPLHPTDPCDGVVCPPGSTCVTGCLRSMDAVVNALLVQSVLMVSVSTQQQVVPSFPLLLDTSAALTVRTIPKEVATLMATYWDVITVLILTLYLEQILLLMYISMTG